MGILIGIVALVIGASLMMDSRGGFNHFIGMACIAVAVYSFWTAVRHLV